MSLSNAYLDHAIACLVRVAEVSYRRIFNGAALYHQGAQFALIVNDRLYFRADDYSRALYQHQGMSAFQPQGVSLESNFYQLPDRLLDNPAELRYWVRIAVEAALHNYSLDEDPSLVAPVAHLRARA